MNVNPNAPIRIDNVFTGIQMENVTLYMIHLRTYVKREHEILLIRSSFVYRELLHKFNLL